jgi:hypothetical protein
MFDVKVRCVRDEKPLEIKNLRTPPPTLKIYQKSTNKIQKKNFSIPLKSTKFQGSNKQQN